MSIRRRIRSNKQLINLYTVFQKKPENNIIKELFIFTLRNINIIIIKIMQLKFLFTLNSPKNYLIILNLFILIKIMNFLILIILKLVKKYLKKLVN